MLVTRLPSPEAKGPSMSTNTWLLLLAELAAGALMIWLRVHDDPDSKAPRWRLRWLGLVLGLAVLTRSAIAALTGTFFGPASNLISNLWIAALAALLFVLPAGLAKYAKRIVPAGMIVLGVAGLSLVRGYEPSGHQLGFGDAPTWYAIALAQAWAFVLLGGWLGWRELRDHPVAARQLLGTMALDGAAGQPWGLLLLPLVLALAELVAHPLWSVPLLAVSVLVIRSWPRLAGQLAAAGTVAFGVLGFAAAHAWHPHGAGNLLAAAGAAAPGVAAPHAWVPVDALYGLVAVMNGATRLAAEVQGVALVVLGCWLVPRTFPAVGRLLGFAPAAELTRQVQRLTQSRAVVVDTAASDLRRLERDLHDGAQARLVALGMNLRAAERLIPVNPHAAVALVAEAREASARALTELRELVRGVHPPVLADRGLADAVRALALDSPLQVETDVDLPGRPPAPVETACYFAVAELLTNAAKHSGARQARIDARYRDGRLRIEVTDFGLGGADPAAGSGLAGVERRLAAFDGIVAISSPAGGPTIVALELPCALSVAPTRTR
jgi:signal transduction histidine kinase